MIIVIGCLELNLEGAHSDLHYKEYLAFDIGDSHQIHTKDLIIFLRVGAN